MRKGATRIMDNLLEAKKRKNVRADIEKMWEAKESAKRRKNVAADIEKMWEMYRENVQAGHIRAPDPIEDARASEPITSGPPVTLRVGIAEYHSTEEANVLATDSIEDEPSTPVTIRMPPPPNEQDVSTDTSSSPPDSVSQARPSAPTIRMAPRRSARRRGPSTLCTESGEEEHLSLDTPPPTPVTTRMAPPPTVGRICLAESGQDEHLSLDASCSCQSRVATDPTTSPPRPCSLASGQEEKKRSRKESDFEVLHLRLQTECALKGRRGRQA